MPSIPMFNIQRLLELLDGAVVPKDEFEAHFVQSGKYGASPNSNIEIDCLGAVEKYKADLKNGRAKEFAFYDLYLELIRARRNIRQLELALQDAKENEFSLNKSLTRSREKCERLNSDIEFWQEHCKSCEEFLDEGSSALTKLEDEFKRKQIELDETQRETLSLREQLEESASIIANYESTIDSLVAERLDAKTRNIIQMNEDAMSANQKLAAAIAELAIQLRKFVPRRIKCPECEGIGTWYDMSTHREGADWDGGNISSVCSSCSGAGYIDNPARTIIEGLG